jgi:hypothetical protein
MEEERGVTGGEEEWGVKKEGESTKNENLKVDRNKDRE